MESITFIVQLRREDGRSPADITVELNLPRPDGWADATLYERRQLTRSFGNRYEHPDVVDKIVHGYHVINIIDPVCECVVQNVPERDPLLSYAGSICRRCGGPLP